jgi:GTPase-associated protein 1, N-terminal domain type 1
VTITIHQAICGEQNKAWELLQTTLSDNSIAKKIAFQTDLQDSPPSGLQWLPVIRGFLFSDYFLLIKTYPDDSPDVRNGRVFSHCLIIDKADLLNISDISPLLSVFKLELDKSIQLEPIILTSDKQETVILKDSLQLRFNKVIQSFLKFTNNSEPIIWVGQKHFDIAVCKLWQLLTPTQRENFHFGINFNPSEVAKDKLSFVVIPDNSESKFENKGFTIIRKEDSVELKEFSEQYLAREPRAISRIENFISAIEVSYPTTREISTIAKGVPTFENVEREKDLKLLNTLSNIVAKFSPDEHKGTSFKAKLVERISVLSEKADESDIFLLRNFPTKSFAGSEIKISFSLEKWIFHYLLDEKQNQKSNYVLFIFQVTEAPQANWLVKLISQKISNFLSDINKSAAKIIWQWILNDVKILKIISDKIENTQAAEKYFYDSVPKVSDEILLEVKSFSSKRMWFKLHATIVKSQFDFEIAIQEQLKVDLDKNNFEGIEIITKGVNPNKLVAFAVWNGEKRCIHLSGKFCQLNPKLLSDIQIEDLNWQEIWLEAINNGNKITDGIKEPQKVIHLLFDLLIKGKVVNESLLEKIGDTDYANVLNYENRNELWSKLPSKAKGKFLEKTSSALLQALSDNSTYQVPADNDLSGYIISNAISVFLYHNRSNIKNVLPIFNTYNQLPEHILRDYINNYSGLIDVVDATQLGQLTNQRNYKKVAYTIFQKTLSGKQYKVALAECYELLELIPKSIAWATGLISKIVVSADEWWNAFTQLSYTLYEEGPTQNKIWTQADGKGYDLETKGSGKEVWIAALQKLRKDNCAGDITVKKLLKVMIEENKKNQELKTLKNLWNKI